LFRSRNRKSIYLAPLESKLAPLQIPLAKGGDVFWLDERTVGHVVSGGDGKPQELYAISVKFETEPTAQLTTPDSPKLIGTFPNGVTVQNFRYSLRASRLVFSAYVYADTNLTSVKEQDEVWEKRGNSAFVYDDTFVRHWDTWRSPKRSSLFSVRLAKDPNHDWHLGDDYTAPLKGTRHVSTAYIMYGPSLTTPTTVCPCRTIRRYGRFRRFGLSHRIHDQRSEASTRVAYEAERE
jgi:hypothetical protein